MLNQKNGLIQLPPNSYVHNSLPAFKFIYFIRVKLLSEGLYVTVLNDSVENFDVHFFKLKVSKAAVHAEVNRPRPGIKNMPKQTNL